MKTIYKTSLFLILGVLLANCASTNRLTLGVAEPAPVFISSDIKKVGIINRSIASENNKSMDRIDQILSAEGLNLDKDGAEASINSLFDELTTHKRFDKILIIDSLEVVRQGLGVFPAELPWKTVEAICKTNEVDILFSLEYYDTDTKVDYQMTTVSVPNSFGVKVSLPGHKVTMQTYMKNGWRIYDPQPKALLDVFTNQNQITSVGEGINPMKAVEAVVGRKQAVIQQSINNGRNYGSRLQPRYKRVSRDYFVKGTDNFEIAKRKAQAGDWDGAAKLWEKELTHSKSKIAGRACYNMAISNEINGDLDKAIEWASKSYTDYNTKEALPYIKILRNRVAKQAKLESQQSN